MENSLKVIDRILLAKSSVLGDHKSEEGEICYALTAHPGVPPSLLTQKGISRSAICHSFDIFLFK